MSFHCVNLSFEIVFQFPYYVPMSVHLYLAVARLTNNYPLLNEKKNTAPTMTKISARLFQWLDGTRFGWQLRKFMYFYLVLLLSEMFSHTRWKLWLSKHRWHFKVKVWKYVCPLILNFAPDGGKFSASRRGHVNVRERAPEREWAPEPLWTFRSTGKSLASIEIWNSNTRFSICSLFIASIELTRLQSVHSTVKFCTTDKQIPCISGKQICNTILKIFRNCCLSDLA